MGESLVALGPGNPMKDVWLPVIFSDKLLLQCSIYTSSVHMSSIYGIDIMYNVDVMNHRMRTLILLNERLASLTEAVNDITLTSVLGFLAQVVCAIIYSFAFVLKVFADRMSECRRNKAASRWNPKDADPQSLLSTQS